LLIVHFKSYILAIIGISRQKIRKKFRSIFIARDRERSVRFIEVKRNRQPFKFIFVKDPELRRKIVSQACHQEFLVQPPVLMVACCEKGDSFNVAIAADHMILAATDEGLGTCWVAWFDAEKVKALLDIPADFDVPIIVPIGFADESPVQRPRKSLEELITVI
jgi:nitroreductase